MCGVCEGQVLQHDFIVRMSLVRMVALVKYQKREISDADSSGFKSVNQDLRGQYNDVILLHHLRQRLVLGVSPRDVCNLIAIRRQAKAVKNARNIGKDQQINRQI